MARNTVRSPWIGTVPAARRTPAPARAGVRWLALLRTPHAIVFGLLLVVYCYTPPRWQDWNQNSRFALTMAIVEHGRVWIDDYADTTGDYAAVGEHFYSDKAPGLSLAAVPVYAATRALQPFGLGAIAQRLGSSSSFTATLNPSGAGTSAERIDRALALYLATIVTVAIPAALLIVLLALLVERLWGCRTAGMVTALTFGFATPLLPYAGAFYGHVPAAACVAAAFSLLALRPNDREPGVGRLAAFGCCLGLLGLSEYPALLIALPIALWALALARWRAILWCGLGALPPLALLAGYDLLAFGTLLPTGYAHSALWQEQHHTGFMSITYPRGDALWGLAFSPFRGLLFYSPVLLLALPGLWLAWRERTRRAEVLVAGTGATLALLFFASSVMWWGGFAVGPRYLVPALPLLAVPFGAFVAWCNGLAGRARLAGLGSVAVLAGISFLLTGATTIARQSYPPDSLRNPLGEYVLPALREGDIARNVGMAMHLDGLASLLPLGLVLVFGVASIGLNLIGADLRKRKGAA